MKSQFKFIFCLEVFILNNAIKKICLVILGLLQGTFGSYLALLGWMFAFPETSPGTKDYEENMSFVPFGYIIMFTWLAIMIIAIIQLRKNKANFLSFIISWLMGLVGCLVVFVILWFFTCDGFVRVMRNAINWCSKWKIQVDISSI